MKQTEIVGVEDTLIPDDWEVCLKKRLPRSLALQSRRKDNVAYILKYMVE